MKKQIFLSLIMVVALLLPQTLRAEATIWIKSATNPYVYAWDNDNTELLGAWPGTRLTQQDAGWWLCYIAGDAPVNFIINNRNSGWGNQTADITGVSGTHFYDWDGDGDKGTAPDVTGNTSYTFPTAVVFNEENFPDPLFRSYLRSKFGVTSVGVIVPTDKLNSVTYIEINRNNTASLKGIEHLAALTTLHCQHTLLTELDVSKNAALREIWCSDNQLTELDVSKNSELSWLQCTENQLTNLDVSENANLQILNCGGNPLKTIDVSHNSALIELDCWENQLTDLDISHNTNLLRLLCRDNQLKVLDFSNNPRLDELYCRGNQLVELDLSNHPAMYDDWGRGPDYFGNQNRDIEAEVGWTVKDDKEEKFYYVSLDRQAGRGNQMQTLAQKLGVEDHAEQWWSKVNKETMTGATLLSGMRQTAAADDIDPNTVYGDILVLTPTAETASEVSGSINYAYDMGYTGIDSYISEVANRMNFTLNWTADPTVYTGVLRLGDGVEVPVSEVQFVNPAGQVSDRPWPGVNIVVKRYSDGTVTTSKQLK